MSMDMPDKDKDALKDASEQKMERPGFMGGGQKSVLETQPAIPVTAEQNAFAEQAQAEEAEKPDVRARGRFEPVQADEVSGESERSTGAYEAVTKAVAEGGQGAAYGSRIDDVQRATDTNKAVRQNKVISMTARHGGETSKSQPDVRHMDPARRDSHKDEEAGV